ncbi:PHD finger protein 14-like, partial [Diaphorina citri]|uniref:PHD finger protein 14-like n=1 Tax=Diaphorina citri TaxID=121845 RepID=A0A3Q0J819_DIACI
SVERDPNKRRIKPPTQNYLDFEDLGESSDDSDFRIEDHAEDSDDDTINSDDSNGPDEGNAESSSDSDESLAEKTTNGAKPGPHTPVNILTAAQLKDQISSHLLLKHFFYCGLAEKTTNGAKPGPHTPVNILTAAQLKDQLEDFSKFSKILVCCVCLGERSDDVNEIVECDSCGVTVHEGCYGVQDTASISSTVSSCSTEPWFCESCRAGIAEPTCELCPNFGGIFKETDVGKWVHLVCALYIPGVAFGEVDRLSNVTLFEMPYSRWGAKSCALCPDESYARTGEFLVYMEVVFPQPPQRKLGKYKVKYVDMKSLRNPPWEVNEKIYGRIQRKLGKYKVKYVDMKSLRNPPWVPTQKLARPLTSSATLCRALLHKARLMEVDTGAVAQAQSDLATLADMNKKWHIPLAFNVEFVAYFLNRNGRLGKLTREQRALAVENDSLQSEQSRLQKTYDELIRTSEKRTQECSDMRTTLELYHKVLLQAVPNKKLPNLDSIGKSNLHVTSNHHPLAGVHGGGVPTAAALKAGVGFPIRNLMRTCSSSPGTPTTTVTMATNSSTSGVTMTTGSGVLSHKCGLCHLSHDPHTMAKCDTCHLYYHLACLDPPLLRMPKKTKLMGW